MSCWSVAGFAVLTTCVSAPLRAEESNTRDDATAGASSAADPAEQAGAGPDSGISDGEANVPLAGHSSHGAAYNEGPRQDAYLMEGTGHVEFPLTTESDEARAFFLQGLGQLHGFWWYEAERSFRRVRALDPQCAMAYWGLAMANMENEERSRNFIAEAIKLKEQVTEREQRYIESLNAYLTQDKEEKELRRDYVKAWERLIRDYPEDIEAKAFLAVHLWQSSRHGLEMNSHQAVDSLLGDVFRVNPMHPAHHYRIHLWDNEDPQRALPSAARGGQAAPRIAHMWHMPGHIYSRLKRYDDAVWQQEASARVDHANMMRDQVLPDQIHNYAHNNEWLIRNLIHLGRWRDALALAKNMLELPRHPTYNSFSKDGTCSCKYGRRRLFQVLETFELWDQAIALQDSMYLEPTDLPEEQANRLRLLGLAHYHRGEGSRLAACVASLEQLRADLQHEAEIKQREASEKATAENRPKDEIQEAGEKAAKNATRKRKSVQRMISELRGLQDLARSETELAKALFAEAGSISKARLARYAFLTGDHHKSKRLLDELVQRGEKEVPPLAIQVDLLRRMGEQDAAQEAFEILRDVAATADLDSPLLQRLAGFAKELTWPLDWRRKAEIHDDTGDRPDLASLGPVYWGPWKAPPWTAVSDTGQQYSASAYAGRPVVLIFYLGFGCLHCVEQLHEFAPLRKDFAEAGISLIAISTESAEQIKGARADFSPDEFPLPLLPNPQLELFKAFRAFDDFEQAPLHGTFLIDGRGRVRWSDISYEPFMDGKFLLQEAKRLLGMKPSDQLAADGAAARR